MSAKSKLSVTLNTATVLTFLRIFIIPIIFGALLLETKTSRWIAAALFMVACATDYMDGLIARNFQQKTRFGEFLDPVADKLLVGSTLLFLAGFQHLQGHALIPAAIILCREILVSGLREWLSHFHETMPVSALAKWKTATQLVAITLVMLGHPDTIGDRALTAGVSLLYVASILTLITGAQYLSKVRRYFA
jgi:cardiolipin synthase